MANTESRISIFGLPKGHIAGSEVVVGSEDPLHFFKRIFVQEGPNGTHFDNGQFEIKTCPIYARPNNYLRTITTL